MFLHNLAFELVGNRVEVRTELLFHFELRPTIVSSTMLYRRQTLKSHYLLFQEQREICTFFSWMVLRLRHSRSDVHKRETDHHRTKRYTHTSDKVIRERRIRMCGGPKKEKIEGGR